MNLRTLLLWVVCLGCVGGYDLVAPKPNVAPTFSFQAFATQYDSTRVDFVGSLTPGTDAESNANTFSDSLVYVDSRAVTPAVDNGVLYYRTGYSAPRVDSMRVRLPVKARTITPFTITIRTPAREDPLNVTVQAGSDLRLHVSLLPAPSGYSVQTTDWVLELHRKQCAETATLTLRSSDHYPPEIVVPWSWFATSRGDSLVACFQSFLTLIPAAVPYPTFGTVIMSATWRVHVQ